MWEIIKNAREIGGVGGYRGELSYDCPQVPFCTAQGALCFEWLTFISTLPVFFWMFLMDVL